MRTGSFVASAAILATPALANAAANYATFVSSEALQALINLDDLLAGSQKLQDFADANGGNRAFGGAGHNATVEWLAETLSDTGYFDVVKQPFVELFFAGEATLSANDVEYDAGVMTYSPSGQGSAPVAEVSNLGCAADDFPAEVEGNVALISRGDCTFAQKVINAKAAGAAAAIVYNNVPDSLSGTLGGEGDDSYVPVVGVSQADGNQLLDAVAAGDEVVATWDISGTVENRTNYNVIAETKQGDKNNVLVLGGHSDSVAAGPGINDDGSGTVGVWAVALALTGFKIKNSVRFAFWGAEEFGKLGSYHYVETLNGTQGEGEGGGEAELAKMRAYLNFDMIASPNYVYGIYDGDGNAFNLSGPAGSAEIERDFELFYADHGERSVPSEFSGRSDYAAFIENGIPSGGLFTGAEVLKTPEEAVMFGGDVGVSYDVNYHKAGDTIDNLAHDAYLLNTKAIANSVAKYAMSFDSLPPVNLAARRVGADRARAHAAFRRRAASAKAHTHAGGPCGSTPDLS